MINEILDIASKYVDSAEVYYLENKSTPVNFESNKLKSVETKDISGVALRVIKDGKLGFSSTTDLEPSKFGQLVKFAVEVAEFGTEVDWNFPTNKIESSSIKMKKAPDMEFLVNTGKNLIEYTLKNEPETINGVSLNYNSSREIIMNTNGVSGHRERDAISFSLYSQLIRGNDMLGIYDGSTINSTEINYLELSNRILELLKNSKAIFQVNTKSMPVIFTPKAMNSLLIPIEPALNGNAILKGSSYFTKKLGKKVMDERITIYEDPSQGTNPLHFDDEGTPTTKKSFIEHGILNGFYYDIQTAAEAKTKSTGNGFRGGLSGVSPSLSTLVFEGGDKTFSEMVEGVEEGVIIDQLLGAGQGNTLSGAFSLNIALGFLIEKGKVVGRIKDCMIAGNTFDALNDIKDIEKNGRWISGGTKKLPSVLFNNMNVISKNK
ncbi:MAG: TldD/PmbA family protein [Candidatus Sericytochromatia bacterium]|nr:TldD/PmbA family protein [Candidatus Sericytochromatia bacterium]